MVSLAINIAAFLFLLAVGLSAFNIALHISVALGGKFWRWVGKATLWALALGALAIAGTAVYEWQRGTCKLFMPCPAQDPDRFVDLWSPDWQPATAYAKDVPALLQQGYRVATDAEVEAYSRVANSP